MRRVIMECQKFQIPEDLSQTLPDGRRWAQLGRFFYFFNFPEFRKKRFLAATLANIRLSKFSSRSWVRRGLISCSTHTSFDELNDGVVNPERGELVRGSDPLMMYMYSAHSTAGDLWRAPIRLLLRTHFIKLFSGRQV